jgi:hypothetical protein
MKTPTHEEISHQAHELWQGQGCPEGHDTEIWLQAERQLSGDQPAETFNARAASEMAAESRVEFVLPAAMPEQEAIKVALQTQAARAPQFPHHTGTRAKPPETGKPLWPKPHSS